MASATMGPEIGKAALIIVDMQNDFVHPEGDFAQSARETPEAGIDMPFLMGTVRYVGRLAGAFREAGRPVVYIALVLKPDYSDAQFPYWRLGLIPGGNRTHCVEGTWGAQIIDELRPQEDEHLVVKKGFGGSRTRRSTRYCAIWALPPASYPVSPLAPASRIPCAAGSSIIIRWSSSGTRLPMFTARRTMPNSKPWPASSPL
jgi:isochorismatase family protein